MCFNVGFIFSALAVGHFLSVVSSRSASALIAVAMTSASGRRKVGCVARSDGDFLIEWSDRNREALNHVSNPSDRDIAPTCWSDEALSECRGGHCE